MFGSKLASNANGNSKPIPESSGVSTATGSQPAPAVAANLTNQSNPDTSSSDSKCNVPAVCDGGDSSSSSESYASMQQNSATNSIVGMPNDNIAVTANKTIISPPPPLPPSLTSTLNGLNTFGNPANSNQDGKIRKLNTFGKLVAVQTNDNPANKLPANVLPKNNLNGLNQSETVKILRTSSPNKKKGPAPSPPINCTAARIESANDKTAKIVRVNKKNEKIAFLNGSPHSRAHQPGQPIKLEGQRNGSVVDGGLSGGDNQANYLSAKPDLSLSSLSIKVQAQ